MVQPDKIFISYRKEDSSKVAKKVAKTLHRKLPDVEFFLDQKGIETATDWSSQILTELMNSNAVLALIGRRWTNSFQYKTSSTDIMLREIEWAFDNGKKVLPVLVSGATMPSLQEIPPSIQQLYRIQAFCLRKSNFNVDINNLAEQIKRLVSENPQVKSPLKMRAATPVFTGKWESQIKVPNGNNLLLEFSLREGTQDVYGHATLASDKMRRSFSAKYYFKGEEPTGESTVHIFGITLDGFVDGLGPFFITLPINKKRGGVYVGQNEDGWTFWTRRTERAW